MAFSKPSRSFLLTAIFFLSLSAPTLAGVVSGKVRDARGDDLPFATVFVVGTTIGTTANAQGFYTLTLPDGSYTLACQFIGYVQQRKEVTVNATQTLNFTLHEQKNTIAEVVVKANAEDPAYAIIRKTIRKRRAHLNQFKSFQTDIYLKGALRLRNLPTQLLGVKIDPNDLGADSGRGVVYLLEEEATVYHRGDQRRTVVHAVRETGNPNGVGFAQLPPIISFYENNIQLGELTPRGQVSPIADNALNFYRYKLESEYREGNHTIFKILVTPKRDYEPLFFGHIYIVEDDYAIHSLSLSATGRQMLEQLDTLRIEQQYVPTGKDQWIIKSQLLYPTIGLMGFSVAGNFVTIYSNQAVNTPMPDSLFQSKAVSVYDPKAIKQDSNYWSQSRPLELEADELTDVRRKDSLLAVEVDPARKDSLRRRGNRLSALNLLLSGQTWTGKKGQRTSISSVLASVSYNTVEGLVLKPEISHIRTVDSYTSIAFRLAPRYGFGYDRFQAAAGVSLYHRSPIWSGRGWGISLSGGRSVYQYDPQRPVDELLNTFSTLFASNNYLKLYQRAGAGLSFQIRPSGGLRVNAGLQYQDRSPLYNTSFHSTLPELKEHFTPNLPDDLKAYPLEPHRAFLASVGVSYQPGSNRYIQYPDRKVNLRSKWPVLGLSATAGIPNIGDSKVDFVRWRGSLSDEVSLRLFGELSYKLTAGGFLKKNYVGTPDLNFFQGNQFSFAAHYLRSFQLLPFYRYSNDAPLFGEVHAEYNMQGLFTNKLPLFRQARWFFILGGNALYVDESRWYGEAFVSVDNLGWKLFRVLRVDFVQGWDAQGRTNTGIRVGLRTGGLIRVDTGGGGGEW